MANHLTLEEVFYLVQESCVAAGIDRHYVTLPVFLSSLREIMDEWGDLGGQLTGELNLTGRTDYHEIPGIFGIIRAYIGTSPVMVYDEQTYESMKQSGQLSDNAYMVKIGEDKIYLYNIAATDEMILLGRVSINDINEYAIKISFPEIDEHLVKWGVSALIKKDRGKYTAAAIDEEHYHNLLGRKISKEYDKQGPPNMIPIDYFG